MITLSVFSQYLQNFYIYSIIESVSWDHEAVILVLHENDWISSSISSCVYWFWLREVFHQNKNNIPVPITQIIIESNAKVATILAAIFFLCFIFYGKKFSSWLGCMGLVISWSVPLYKDSISASVIHIV